MSDGFDMGDALVGAMIFGPVLNPPTFSPSRSSSSGARAVDYSGELADLRAEVAELRRNLDVAFMILVQHGLAPMPEQKDD